MFGGNGRIVAAMVQEKIRHTTLRSGAFSRVLDKDNDKHKEKAKNENKLTVPEESFKSRNPFRKLMKSKSSSQKYTNSTASLYPSVSTASSGSSSAHSSGPSSHRKKKDNRKILFDLHESEISVYKALRDTSSESLNTIDSSIHYIIKNSKPSLIAQGKFQIYQMSSTLNYLSCGSLTHPILPSCTFVKVNINTYIIPIKNPTRYWRLTLNTEDDRIIKKFESTVRPISRFKTDILMDFTLDSPFCTIIDTFNTFTTSSSSSVTLKSFLHVDSDDELNDHVLPAKIGNAAESLPLHHPIPVRPNSASTTSVKSSILHKYNSTNSLSSLNTSQVSCGDEIASTRKASEIHAISESTEVQHIQNKSSNDLSESLPPQLLLDLDVITDSDFELDLDLDLEMDLNLDELYMDICPKATETNNDTGRFGKRSISASDLDELDDVDLETDDLLCMWNDLGDGIAKRYSLSFKAYDLKKPVSIDVFDKYKGDIKSVLKNDSTGLLNDFVD